MYHNWFELKMVTQQVQKDLYRQASEARLADSARKRRTEEKKRARQARPSTVVSASATFILRRNEVISIRVSHRNCRIACVAGRLWTTIDDSPADAMLVAGETMTYRKSGKIVVQALRTATVRIERPSPLRIDVGSQRSPVFTVRTRDRSSQDYTARGNEFVPLVLGDL